MTLLRVFFFALVSILLGSCDVIKGNVSDCGANRFDKNESIREGVVTEATSKVYEFYKPSEQFSGISSAQISGSMLSVTLVNKLLYEQYSAPKTNTFKTLYYPAEPGWALMRTIFFVGSLWVLEPVHMYYNTFGCTDKIKTGESYDSIKQVKTGVTEWKANEESHGHTFMVSGFNRDYYEYDPRYESNQANIDLTQAILTTNLTSTTTLKVTCMDCDLLGPEEQKLNKDTKKTIELTYDFRPIKESLLKVDKERAIQRELQEKENKKAEKERNGAPINRFKEQCMQLGFKVGTQDFGNCVLELNDAK